MFDGADRTRCATALGLGSFRYHLAPPDLGIVRPRSNDPRDVRTGIGGLVAVPGYLIPERSHLRIQ